MAYSIQDISNREIWDTFLENHNPTALFQSWTWGDVQQRLGNRVHRFGCFRDGHLGALFQVVTVLAKRGTFVHVRHGPIVAKQDLRVWKQVLLYLKIHAKQEGALFVRISPLVNPQFRNELQRLGTRDADIHAMDAEYCWVLPLDKPLDVLLQQMRKTTRYEIRKAEQIGVKVAVSNKVNDLKTFQELYLQTAKRQGFVPHRGIQEEFEQFSARNEALLFTAYYQNQAIATALILYTGTQGIYHHGASVTNKIPGSYAIQWQAIQEAKRRGMTVYNFWGIAPEDQPNHPWQGLTLFKKGFGGEVREFLHAQDLPVSPLYLIPSTIEKIRKLRKGY